MGSTAAGHPQLVVNFHGLGPIPEHVGIDESYFWCVDVGLFSALFDSIVAMQARNSLPVRITFDDGNISDHAIALPLLIERGLTAEFFVWAGRIGADHYVDAGQMAEMLSAGMSIGSHGWNHVNWRRADAATLDQEIDTAKSRIEAEIGQPIDSVAIPFGSYDRRVVSRLGGFSTIYNSDGGLTRAGARHMARNSYTRNWSAQSIANLAGSQSAAQQLKRDLFGMIKRLR
jgi:peptidoglycan/xylan/chitin deacetylase (PgdA/CDA1 family)